MMMTVRDAGAKIVPPPDLDTLLSTSERHNEPWLPENFLQFLQEEYGEENLYFYLEVDALKSLAHEGAKRDFPRKDLLVIPSSDRANKSRYLRAIVQTFIQDKAPKQVNISHVLRDKIIAQVQRYDDGTGEDLERGSDEGEFEKSLVALEEAQTEIKQLLLHGPWKRFYERQMTQNLSPRVATHRYKYAILYAFVAMLAYALMMAYYVPRWYLFLLFFPLLLGANEIVRAKTRLCCTLASRGMTRKIGMGSSTTTAISCPYVLASTRRRAKKLRMLMISGAIVITLFLFTTTYMVEASLGQLGVLYG